MVGPHNMDEAVDFICKETSKTVKALATDPKMRESFLSSYAKEGKSYCMHLISRYIDDPGKRKFWDNVDRYYTAPAANATANMAIALGAAMAVDIYFNTHSKPWQNPNYHDPRDWNNFVHNSDGSRTVLYRSGTIEDQISHKLLNLSDHTPYNKPNHEKSRMLDEINNNYNAMKSVLTSHLQSIDPKEPLDAKDDIITAFDYGLALGQNLGICSIFANEPLLSKR